MSETEKKIKAFLALGKRTSSNLGWMVSVDNNDNPRMVSSPYGYADFKVATDKATQELSAEIQRQYRRINDSMGLVQRYTKRKEAIVNYSKHLT